MRRKQMATVAIAKELAGTATPLVMDEQNISNEYTQYYRFFFSSIG
jgi:hypothetical protein